MGRKATPNLPEKAQKRADRLVELYEREAYRIYNLTLRTSGDPAAAGRATGAAFLRFLANPPSEESSEAERRTALLKEAVAAALAEQPRKPARKKPADSGEKLLDANSRLSGPERAAIALISIDAGSAGTVATVTETTPKAAGALIKQAREGLSTQSGIAAGKLSKALGDWAWVEPPAEIWEGLYPQAHKLLAEQDEPKAATTKTSKSRSDRRRAAQHSPLAARVLRGPGIGTRLRGGLAGATGLWAFRAAVLAIVLVPPTVVLLVLETGPSGTHAEAQSNVVSGSEAGTSADGSALTTEGGSTYDALSPKELDQLRLQELDDLREYSRAQADKTLSASEQAAAAQEAEELLALARQRLAEAEQREQQAAAREEQSKQQATPAPTAPPTTTVQQPATGKKKGKKKKRKPAPAPGPSISDCLFDEESGTYICPE